MCIRDRTISPLSSVVVITSPSVLWTNTLTVLFGSAFTVTVGVLSFVKVVEVVIVGLPGTVSSIVIDSSLDKLDVFPAASVANAVMRYVPSGINSPDSCSNTKVPSVWLGFTVSPNAWTPSSS